MTPRHNCVSLPLLLGAVEQSSTSVACGPSPGCIPQRMTVIEGHVDAVAAVDPCCICRGGDGADNSIFES